MLKFAGKLRELDFDALMEVYEEGNLKNGADRYPDLSENEQYLRAREDFYTYLRESFFCVPGAVYAMWEKDGRYVSALRLEPYRDGLLLEALETAPDKRGRGYATLLVRSALDALTGGQSVYSHVSRKNIASLAVHKACGFERIQQYAVCIDGSVLNDLCTLRWRRRSFEGIR